MSDYPDKKQWRAWVIKRNRLTNVLQHIKENIPEIDKYFYPMIKKEYHSKRGAVTKDRPLYEGYLFIHYNNHDVVFHKMNSYPFVTTYAGLVEDEEIIRMQESQGKLLTELKRSRFSPGDSVYLLEGPFKGFEGVVLETLGNNIKVKIEAQMFGKPVEMVFKEEVLERKTQIQNTEVQDI